jgi:predicted membrane metal-binding protein
MLRILGKILWGLFLIAAIIAGFAFAFRKNWLKVDLLHYVGLDSNKIMQPSGKINPEGFQFSVKSEDWQNLGEDGVAQAKVFANNAMETAKKTQTFLGQAVQVDQESEKNLSEKAFDYGRYLYCQQVVQSYENGQASESASTK